MRIICVIVTYNRLDLLKQAFHAVSMQTFPPNFTIIVDNCSTDGTRDWLASVAAKRSDIRPILLDSNYGGAGGFHYGLKAAYELGADWIWVMDDDTIPDPEALGMLVKCGLPGSDEEADDVGFLASEVVWKDGASHRMNVPGPAKKLNSNRLGSPEAIEIDYASFVSILISRNAVRRVGFPIKQFFIHGDDVEFTSRVTAAGFSAFYIPSSRVMHRTETNCGVTLEAIATNIWQLQRRKYTIRNLIAVNRRREFGWFKEPARLCYLLALMIRKRLPLKIQAELMWAGISGLWMNYEKWIEYPSLGAPDTES